MSDIDKKALKKRLESETPLLKNDGWEDKEIDLLKKHFTFFYTSPLNINYYINFRRKLCLSLIPSFHFIIFIIIITHR